MYIQLNDPTALLLLNKLKFNVRHIFVYVIITTQAYRTTFPEENAVYFKEVKKIKWENGQC